MDRFRADSDSCQWEDGRDKVTAQGSEGRPVTPTEKRPWEGRLTWTGDEIPSLYGLRGLVAMAVVLSHLGLTAVNAIYSVICFFVLSGFLITYLLLREIDKTGDISLRRFYCRRTLRIFPAFYVYAAVYVTLKSLMHHEVEWPAVMACLTYTGNYYFSITGHPDSTMAHTWSLAVEEQFYLLWPFIVWRLRGNRPLLIRVLIGAIVGVWAYRWFAASAHFEDFYVFAAFETRADALGIGCLIAVANREGCLPRWIVEWKWLAPVGLVALAVSSAIQLNGPRYSWTLVALVFAVVLVQAVAHAHTVWYRFLNSRPFYLLCLISYSLYLYHPFANNLPERFHILAVGVPVAILLATGSYWIVERPFLNLKDRLFSVSKSATR